LDDAFLAEQGISVSRTDDEESGATHALELAGIGGKEKLDVLVMTEMLTGTAS
jgi:hypothetical protein